jgi:hypothetical protein
MGLELAVGNPGTVAVSNPTYDVNLSNAFAGRPAGTDLKAVLAHFNFTAIGGATTIGLGVYHAGSDAVFRLIGGATGNLTAASTCYSVLVTPDTSPWSQTDVVVAGVTVRSIIVPACVSNVGTLRFQLFIGTNTATYTYAITGVER